MCYKCVQLKKMPVFGFGWQNKASAPKDGTLIEIENRYGAMPSRGVFRWNAKINNDPSWSTGWQNAHCPNSSLLATAAYAWRLFKGDLESYVDPFSGFDPFAFVIQGKRPIETLRASEKPYDDRPSWKRIFEGDQETCL